MNVATGQRIPGCLSQSSNRLCNNQGLPLLPKLTCNKLSRGILMFFCFMDGKMKLATASEYALSKNAELKEVIIRDLYKQGII